MTPTRHSSAPITHIETLPVRVPLEPCRLSWKVSTRGDAFQQGRYAAPQGPGWGLGADARRNVHTAVSGVSNAIGQCGVGRGRTTIQILFAAYTGM